MKRPQSYVRTAVATLAIVFTLPSFAADAATTCAKPVNINTADAATISSCVTGIGPSTADAIVAYRKEHGNFKAVSDIAAVKRVGEKRAAKLAPELTVGDSK
jgi:competence protein ComEA